MKNSIVKLQGYLKTFVTILLLTMGVSSVRGYNFQNPKIYFNNSSLNWSDVMLLVGHGSYSCGYNATTNPISDTKLVYFAPSANWTDQDGFTVCNTTGWDCKSEAFTSRAGYTTHIGLKYSYGFNSGSTYYVTGTTGGSPTISVNYISGGYGSIQKYNASQAAKSRNSINDSYSNHSGTWPANLKLKGTYLSGDGASTRTEITSTSSSDGSAKKTYGAVVTGLITHSYASLSSDWQFDGWGTGSTPSNTNSTYSYNISSATTIYAFFTKKYAITFGMGGTPGTSSVAATAGGAGINSGDKKAGGSEIVVTATIPTGYEIIGWYSNAACTTDYTNGSGGVTISGDKKTFTLAGANFSAAKTIYVKIMPKTYTVNLSYNGQPHYGSGSGTAYVTATFNADMPTPITLPIAADYYGFDGYYTEEDGDGVKYYKADGSSARPWDIDEDDRTLYAYFASPKISVTAIGETSELSTISLSETVNATATLTPTPEGTTVVCWRLLDRNGTPVTPQPTFTPASGNSVSFTGPSTAGTYKVATILHANDESGAVLDSITTSIYVASTHTVTIRYMCNGKDIADRTYMTGEPLAPTSITAPDKTGYSFSKWKAGDGITIEGADASGEIATANINFKARYDGTLTAIYTKKDVIYFNNTLGWNDVWVYFYNDASGNQYWADNYGSGANQQQTFGGNKPFYEGESGHMTRIEGTDIWYFDYQAAGYSTRTKVAFAKKNQKINKSGASNTEAYFYNTEAVYRTDFNANKLPMFVPLPTVSHDYSGKTVKTKYYNNGYWMNYPENTGYWLKIFDKVGDGAVCIRDIPFVFTATKTMPMSLTVDLEASKTYGFKIYRNDGKWYGNTGTMKINNSGDAGQTAWEFREKNDDSSDKPNCGLKTSVAGDYIFTLTYGMKSSVYDYLVGVHYPIAQGDYRIVYKDRAIWSQGTAHAAAWIHPSRAIHKENGSKDTISFFISKADGANASMKFQYASNITSEGVVTWTDVSSGAISISGITESGVYNFCLTQASGAISVENIEPYTGDYYIRTDCAGDTKWDHYRTIDHAMTYTPFSESEANMFGPKYSHYFCHWCTRGTNVKFVIANDYSPCISDTLTKDIPDKFSNINNDGFLLSESPSSDPTTDKYSANIRFMWNRHTNKISRAYVASATTAARQFLILNGCDEIRTSDGGSLGEEGEQASAGDYRALFHDDQDFIYERVIQIQPTTRAKVYACYAQTGIPDKSKAQYFAGEYESSCSDDSKSVQVIGGDGGKFYKVRVIYDFKTNRLIMAWMPNGEDVGDLDVQADVMVIRDHQEGAEAITFSSGGKLDDVKYVYGVMRFNRWTLNNRARGKDGADDQDEKHCNTPAMITEYHGILDLKDQKSIYERALYFISFPFDVNLSDVFGLGTYGTHWIISKYNGLRRAQQGYFEDNCFNSDCTNWDYIWDRKGVTLNAYEGYLLSIEVDSMLYDNTNFWVNNISQKELYFPSAIPMEQITTTNVTFPELGDDYVCKKNYNFDGTHPRQDRRVYDSYWRCIGTPSYAPYGAVVKKDGASGADIQWQTDYRWETNPRTFPFLYEWNVDDNSLSPQSTKKFAFKPLHAYLIQNGNAIYWSAVSATPASIVRRQRRAVDEDGDYYWLITLSRDTLQDDQTYIRMSADEQVTDTFDFGQDLSKEFNYGHSDIYTYIGQTRAAANSMPMNTETTTIIPLGLNIWAAGYHTISLPNGGDGVGIDLVDLYTGERTNLSAGFCYSFLAEKGIIDDRFQLEISPVKGTHTGIEEVNTGSGEERARKVLIDGNLYIVRDGKLYDARGARIK